MKMPRPRNQPANIDHVTRTIETYDQIAPGYHVVSTPENRAWLEDSMREFSFYSRDELSGYFSDYTVEKERRNHLKEGEGAMEFWLRKSGPMPS